MQVFKVSEGSKFTEYSLDNSTKKLTIEGIIIDLEASSLDSCQNILNITRNSDGTCVLGLEGKAGYVADIEIPPRQYRYETTGEGDDEKTDRIPVPLDLNTVVLKLWPYGPEENPVEGGI
jgi:hypothetical protein